jgi:hypothetical protein
MWRGRDGIRILEASRDGRRPYIHPDRFQIKRQRRTASGGGLLTEEWRVSPHSKLREHDRQPSELKTSES